MASISIDSHNFSSSPDRDILDRHILDRNGWSFWPIAVLAQADVRNRAVTNPELTNPFPTALPQKKSPGVICFTSGPAGLA